MDLLSCSLRSPLEVTGPSGPMERMTDRKPKTEHDLGDQQITAAFDQADANTDANVSPAEMNIDPVQLFQQAAEQTRMAMIVTDPHQDDDPIIFVNQAFEEMTGYPREEIIGQNCRFLQGPDTDPAAVRRIRELLEARDVGVVEIRNYRRNGEPFWNTLHVGPIYDEKGELTHFYGSQWDVTELVEMREARAHDRQVAEELRHRTKNLFAVMSAIVNLSAGGAQTVRELAERVTGRLHALSRAHEVSLAPADGRARAADLHALVEEIVRPYRLEGRGRLEVAGPMVELPRETITPLGLTLHELATNAVKYGALGTAEGRVRIEWSHDADRLDLRWTESEGPGIDKALLEPGAKPEPGSGSTLMKGILAGIGASIATTWHEDGLIVKLMLPLEG